MRLRLADVKKSVLRRDGEVYVAPQLLGPRAPLRQIAALVALYEACIGTTRAAFPLDAPGELIGDYRLARCLEICLQEWYVWEPRQWPEGASEAEARALAEREIASPADLRIALYDAVNRDFGGYLAPSDRDTALDAFASACGIRRDTLDALLNLDGDEHAVLRRVTEEPPGESDLMARYNQQVVEALLANAARVEWTLPPAVTDPAGGGLGAVVKRICFLARSMGVQYEVEFAPDAYDERDAPGARELARVAEERRHYGVNRAREAGSDTMAASLDAYLRPLHVTLYGPQEVTGAPYQYGQRLARLCRACWATAATSAGPRWQPTASAAWRVCICTAGPWHSCSTIGSSGSCAEPVHTKRPTTRTSAHVCSTVVLSRGSTMNSRRWSGRARRMDGTSSASRSRCSPPAPSWWPTSR